MGCNNCNPCAGLTLFKGDTGDTGATGATGAAGTNGTNGTNGVNGGYSGDWLFSTSTSSPPSTSQIRFNNATLSSVTTLYISDSNADLLDFDSFLDSMVNTIDSVNYYGMIKIYQSPLIYWYGKITAVVDSGSYHTVTVTYIQSNGTFSNTGRTVVDFTPNSKGSNINTKIISIGSWNMDTTTTLDVAHGLTLDNILFANVIIQNDDGTGKHHIEDLIGGAVPAGNIYKIDATEIGLLRTSGGAFDSTDYNSTIVNRGYITIGYL